MHELMYYSTATENLTGNDISNILKTAILFNSANDITGCLLFHNHDFIQLLEGDQKIIKDLFTKISNDNRHANVYLLAEGEKAERSFKNWSMAFHQLDIADKKNIERFLFIKNFVAVSDLIEKPTEPMRLFFYLAKHLLNEEPIADSKF